MGDDLILTNFSSKIHIIRGVQVMLDFDVALAYQYETKRVNEVVRRNKERFPQEFYFQLTKQEWEDFLRSQFATLEGSGKGQHKKYLPYVFAEQGVAMLAGMLKNEIAIKASINIINAFVGMRKLLSNSQRIFDRVIKVEYKQLEQDDRIARIEEKFDGAEIPRHKLFFDGQIYDAYELLVKIIKTAGNSITIIDNYISDDVLSVLKKKKQAVKAKVISNTSSISKLDITKFNSEYQNLEFCSSNKFHDRYIIVDNEVLYHLGASLKDLGRKIFSISKIDEPEIVAELVSQVGSLTG